MLPRLELAARGIPHTGVMPTGAVSGFSRTKSVFDSLDIVRELQQAMMTSGLLDDRRGCTMAPCNKRNELLASGVSGITPEDYSRRDVLAEKDERTKPGALDRGQL